MTAVIAVLGDIGARVIGRLQLDQRLTLLLVHRVSAVLRVIQVWSTVDSILMPGRQMLRGGLQFSVTVIACKRRLEYQ